MIGINTAKLSHTKFSYKFCARFNIENIGLWDFSGLLQVESHVTIHLCFSLV